MSSDIYSTAEIIVFVMHTTLTTSTHSVLLVSSPVMLADPDVRFNLYNRNSLDKIIHNNSEKNTRSLDVTEIITQACCTLNLRFCCHHLKRMIVSFSNTFPNPH